MQSPVDFETRQQKLNDTGVQETRGTSKANCNKLGNLNAQDLKRFEFSLSQDELETPCKI